MIKNQTNGPVSFFVHGSHEPFMGIWNPHTETGTAHYAEYRELPGKKIWSWGVDAGGLDWRKALSDNDSAYVEVQAGLFRNQETYAFLEPGQTIHFSEFWMPVRGTGGISRANKAGVVYFDTHGAEVSVALNVNERLRGAQISLTQNGIALWSGTADLAPETTWSHSRSQPQKRRENHLRVERQRRPLAIEADRWRVRLGSGIDDQNRAPGNAANSRPGEPIGRRLAAGGPESGIERKGCACACHLRERTGEISAEPVASESPREGWLHRFSSMMRRNACSEHAQKRDTPNSEIAYYLGIAEEGLGHTREAETSYEIAYRQADLREPAAIRLGELRAREGDLQVRRLS